MNRQTIEKEKLLYGIAQDSDHLPALTVTQDWLNEAHKEVFGGEDEIRAVP